MNRPALLCDIGNVLVSFDFTVAAQRCAEFCPHPPGALLSRLDGIKEPYERGELSDADFIHLASRALEFKGSPESLVKIWCDIFEENRAMKSTLTQFAASSDRLFLLSNTNGLHKDYLFDQFPIFQLFKSGIYSYSAKCAKPDRQIFEMAIQHCDLEPEQTLYVDDLEANLVTARAMGFQTHLYSLKNHTAFELVLEEWKASVGLSS